MTTLLFILVDIALLLIIVAILAIRRSRNLSRYDAPEGTRFPPRDPTNEEYQALYEKLESVPWRDTKMSRKEMIFAMRDVLDNMFIDRQFDCSFESVEAGGVSAEWVMAPGADPGRRLLYIHGGAFALGSLMSHRTITTKLSAVANAAVLAIDYRLMPENRRMDGVTDCRTSYQWLIDNGPGGQQQASALFVAGDSAGGNLTLSLISWIRDQGLRAPNGAIALSPMTDSVHASPSLKDNLETDLMLKPLIEILLRLPLTLVFLGTWISNRKWPRSKAISPIYDNLAGLPPVLVQASEHECLFDDSRRYVNKAKEAGSPVTLQSWQHVPHVWQIFNPDLEEAREAFVEIEKFISSVS